MNDMVRLITKIGEVIMSCLLRLITKIDGKNCNNKDVHKEL